MVSHVQNLQFLTGFDTFVILKINDEISNDFQSYDPFLLWSEQVDYKLLK